MLQIRAGYRGAEEARGKTARGGKIQKGRRAYRYVHATEESGPLIYRLDCKHTGFAVSGCIFLWTPVLFGVTCFLRIGDFWGVFVHSAGLASGLNSALEAW